MLCCSFFENKFRCCCGMFRVSFHFFFRFPFFFLSDKHMTTGRINQVFCFFVFFLLVFSFLSFLLFSFFSILSFLILFFFQNDLLLLFREQISLLLRNVPRFVSFFLSFSVFLSLRQAYDYWQDQPGFLLFCFLSSRSFLFFLSFCFLCSQFFLF